MLKGLAYEDRIEEKDAYDIIYSLLNYQDGPASVAEAFVALENRLPEDPMLAQTLDILRRRFASDDAVEGHRKDCPQSYARFLTDPSHPTRDLINRRSAATAIETFLREVAEQKRGTNSS